MATKANEAAKLRITLVKSLTGRKDSHIATAHSLGLRRIGHVTVQPDNEATRGKIAHIGYLIRVTSEA
ncbi:MAG: 50S ribosomal protein L30 [Oscillospiraceae bacterium]|jgi:large subunit ribosomal protein L30|nr:50S ribosomal protein L30 [Oscillospiraceae bacterium]